MTREEVVLLAMPLSDPWRTMVAAAVEVFRQQGFRRLQICAPDELIGPRSPLDRAQRPIAGIITSRIDVLTRRQQDFEGPVVSVASHATPGCGFPRVSVDPVAIGRLAADHLCSLGPREILLFDDPGCSTSARTASCAAILRQCDRPFRLLQLSKQRFQDDAFRNLLPASPCAIFTASDHAALSLIRRLDAMQIGVPDPVAVLGADDREVPRMISPVPISSVAWPAAAIGRRAAQTVIGLIDGGPPPPAETLLAPAIVIQRESTQVTPSDPAVAAALAHLRTQYHRPISIEATATAAGISLRTLQKRFQALRGRSLIDELTEIRFRAACDLLVTTGLDIESIAQQVGYGSRARLHQVFDERGTTPGGYRRDHRPVLVQDPS